MSLDLVGLVLIVAAIIIPGRLTGKGAVKIDRSGRPHPTGPRPSFMGRVRQVLLLAGIICVIVGHAIGYRHDGT